MSGGFQWVVGNGVDIVATKDPWDFRVDNLHIYVGRNECVSTLFNPGTKTWDSERVRELFSVNDANAILATSVPQNIWLEIE